MLSNSSSARTVAGLLPILLTVALCLTGCSAEPEPPLPDAPGILSSLTLQAEGAVNQDDMCIWIHPTDPSLSTIIAGDKATNALEIYWTRVHGSITSGGGSENSTPRP